MNQIEQLSPADLSSLIDNYDCALGKLTPLQTFGDGLRSDKTIASQIENLLSLRRENHRNAPRFSKRLLNFPQNETLAGAGAAAKESDEVGGPKNRI